VNIRSTWFQQQATIISLNSINGLAFVAEAWYVPCEVRNEFLYVIKKKFCYQDNWDTLFLGDINTGTWPSRLGESRIWDSKYGHESRGNLTWEWLHWRGPAEIVNDISILSSERMLLKDRDRECSVEKKNASRDPQGACRQDKLIGGKPPFVKELLLWLCQSVFKEVASSEGSQSRQTVKYDHESRGTMNQKSLCWRGPAAI
jgi:hypothetical protein